MSISEYIEYLLFTLDVSYNILHFRFRVYLFIQFKLRSYVINFDILQAIMSSYRTPKSGTHNFRSPSTSTPTILKKRNTPLNNVPKHKVQINLVDNLKALLISFDQNNDKEKLKYNNLICDIRDAGIEIKVSIFFHHLHFKEIMVW